MFAIVDFDDGTSAVVPISWIIGNNKCLWPTSTDDIKSIEFNRPPKPHWPSFNCKIGTTLPVKSFRTLYKLCILLLLKTNFSH